MIEDFGHRVEGTMTHFFNGWFSGNNTDWDKFTKGRAFHSASGSFPYGCGDVHLPYNATSDYDWSDTAPIENDCAGWLQYPPAPTATQTTTCSPWGCTGYGYKKWWLAHLPHVTGQTNGMWNNWWKYIAGTN